MSVSRRNFLKGAAAGSAGTALAGGVLIGGARADGSTAQAPSAPGSYPFHGAHQAGVLTPGPAAKQSFACFAAFDSIAGSKAELASLDAGTLRSGRGFSPREAPPPTWASGSPRRTATCSARRCPRTASPSPTSAGSTLFDDRYGLAAQKPKKLTPMRAFPNDSPDPAWLHGDLLLQLCANHPDTIHHAIRDITRHTRGRDAAAAGRSTGYNSPPRPSGTSRNLLGLQGRHRQPGRLPGQQPGLGRRPGRAALGARAAPTRWCG